VEHASRSSRDVRQEQTSQKSGRKHEALMSFLSPRNTLQPLNMQDPDTLSKASNSKARAVLTSNVNERSRREATMKPLPLKTEQGGQFAAQEQDVKSNDGSNEFDLYAPFGKTF